MQSSRNRPINLFIAMVAFCLVNASCICRADDNSLVQSIARDLTNSRYMLPKPGESSGPQCVKLEAGNPLLSEPVIKPYADRLGSMPAAATNGVAIMECDYISQLAHLPAYVIMLDIPPVRIATWIVSSCKKVRPGGVDACATKMAKDIVSSNGGQYPISGFVSEGSPTDDLCKQHGVSQRREGLIGFRHGVTVQFTKTANSQESMLYCLTDPDSDDVKHNQKDIALHYPVTGVFHFARVAAVSNDAADVPDGVGPNSWQKTAMDNILAAIETDHDKLMEQKAANQ